jgi:Domain of unknown function (DUF4105)
MRNKNLQTKWSIIVRVVAKALGWLAVSIFVLWAFAALCLDVRHEWLRIPAAVLFIVALLAALFVVKGVWLRMAACVACCVVVLVWWFSLKPSNDPPWEEDLSRNAWAEIHGDQMVVHNVRDCKYRTEKVYSDCWTDRTYDLSQLRGVDFFLDNWGIKFASHPMISFDFGDQHLAFSIEARYRPGQSYSLFRGFYRQFGLIVVAADEGDIIRLRTNYRHNPDEDVYLYRVQVTPAVARAMLMIYINYMNNLKDNPEWYNELTRNCTSTVDTQLAETTGNPQGWSIQLVLNGTMDELMYRRGRLVTGGLTFPQLKEQAHINSAAHAAGDSPDFSSLIRVGRVGY